MVSLEQEAAQPSLGREHSALGWLLGAQENQLLKTLINGYFQLCRASA